MAFAARLRLCFLAALVAAAGYSRAQAADVTAQVVIKHAGEQQEHKASDEVAVWLTPLDGTAPPPAKNSYRMVQKDKQFRPHVLVVPVGAAVEFPNEDPFFHNVFSLYKAKRFDLGLYEAGGTRTIRFDRPGVSFIFCNIHPGMNAYLVAVPTPYFAVSDIRGQVVIPGVPPGKYRLEVWYERADSAQLKRLARDVEVAGSGLSLGVIAIAPSAKPVPSHTDKSGRPYPTDRTPY